MKLRRPFLIGSTFVLAVFTCFRAFSTSPPSHDKARFKESLSKSQRRRPILFVHFDKSGGTSVCDTMRLHQNQVNITDMLGNQDINTQQPSTTVTQNSRTLISTMAAFIPFKHVACCNYTPWIMLAPHFNEIILWPWKYQWLIPCPVKASDPLPS